MADVVLKQAYVAIGVNGLLKVGHTTNVKNRLRSLKQDFKRKGDVLGHWHPCDRIIAAYSVEMELIRICGELYEAHSGREWFKAGDFHRVARIADGLTRKWKHHRYPPLPSEEEQAEMAAFWARWRAERVAARQEAERLTQQRRVKRQRAQRAVQAFVDFALGGQQVGSV